MDDIAIELATAYVSVVPTVRGIQGELQRQLVTPAAAQGRQAGDKAGRGFHDGYAGWIQRIVAVTAAAGIGAAVQKISSAGIKGAANLETLTTAFTSLLGSSKAATDQITQLQAFAAKTPFSQQDVFGYAQQYFSLANSIGLAKDQVQPFLTTIGNIAAVTGASSANIHNAVLAIGQIGSAGKVTLDNLNQISEAFPGFNGAAAIASATGQTTAQVMKEISSGAIDAKTGVQALLQGMQDFPGAAGAMVAQSKTLSGVWSTFTDTIQISLTKAFQPLVPTIKKVLADLTPVIASTLSTFAPAVTTFAQQIVPLLQPLLRGLSTAFTAVFQALGPALAALAPVIQPLASAFAGLVQAIAPLLTFAAQIVAQLGPPLLGMFQQLFAALRPVVSELINALSPVLPVLSDAFSQLAQALAPIASTLAAAFVQFLQSIAPFLPSLVASFANLAVSMAQLAQALAPAVVSFAELAGILTGTFIVVVSHLADLLARVLGQFGQLRQVKSDLGGGGGGGFSLAGLVPGLGPLSDALGLPQVRVNMNDLKDAAQGLNQGLDDLFGTAGQLASGLNAPTNALGAMGLAAQGAGLDILGVSAALDQLSQRNLASDKQQIASAQDVGKARTKAAHAGKPSVPSFKVPGPKLPDFDTGTLASFLSQATGRQANPLTAALNSIIDSAKAAGKQLSSGLVDALRGQNRELIGLTKDRDRIAEKLQNAQQHLADVLSQRTQEAATIKSAVTGTFNIADTQTKFGEPLTLTDILNRLNTAVRNARSFNSILRRLAREGLPKALLQQLAEAGPDALPAARALLTATPKQLGTIKSQFAQLTKSGTSIGSFVAHDMFDAGVKSAQGLVDGLKSKQAALVGAIRQLAKAMIAELRDTLGIHSPSRVLHELGAFSGEGFALGLASKLSAVETSAGLLANGALPRSQAAAWAGHVGAAGTTVNVTQNIHNPIPETVSVSSPAGMRRAAYALGR